MLANAIDAGRDAGRVAASAKIIFPRFYMWVNKNQISGIIRIF